MEGLGVLLRDFAVDPQLDHVLQTRRRVSDKEQEEIDVVGRQVVVKPFGDLGILAVGDQETGSRVLLVLGVVQEFPEPVSQSLHL